MAGFETIIRPAILPNIRPAPTRSLPPEDDPEKGIAVIRGAGGQVIDLTYSWNVSSSRTKAQEIKREVDEKRVHQKEPDGTINRQNFVDMEIATKIWMRGATGPGGTDSTPKSGAASTTGKKVGYEVREYYYSKPADAANIETRETGIIKTNPDFRP